MGLRLTRNDLATYAGLSRAGSDIKQGMKDWAISEAANVTPSQEFSPEQAAELEAAAGVKDAEGNPLYQIKGNEGGTYSVTPTAGGETGTVAPGMQRMGGKTQATPFSQEQIEAQRYRNQADVATRFGDFREASALHGLAKGREEEGVTKSIKSFADEGLKRHGDLTGAKKQWKQLSYMAEAAANAGRMDLWKQYRDSGLAVRGDLMKDAINRADMLYRTTGSIHGYVDAHSDLALDGRHAAAVKTLDDGRHEVQFGNDLPPVIVGDKDDPKNRQISVGTLRLLLSDPAKLAEYEQKATERRIARIEGREDKGWEWQNKPEKLKDADGNEYFATPSTAGKGGAPARLNPKEHQAVLDDIRNFSRDTLGDPIPGDTTGKKQHSPKSLQVAKDAETLYTSGHRLPVTSLQAITTDGKRGTHSVLIDGQPRNVEGFAYGGTLYPTEPGLGPIKIINPQDVAASAVPGSVKRRFDQLQSPDSFQRARQNMGAAEPQIQRQSGGRVSSGQGMSKIGPQSSATPQDFPRVSSSDQAARDVDAGRILVAESGGIEGAKRDLATLDAELSRRGLDGTQRGILQSQRSRLAAGIAALSRQG